METQSKDTRAGARAKARTHKQIKTACSNKKQRAQIKRLAQIKQRAQIKQLAKIKKQLAKIKRLAPIKQLAQIKRLAQIQRCGHAGGSGYLPRRVRSSDGASPYDSRKTLVK